MNLNGRTWDLFRGWGVEPPRIGQKVTTRYWTEEPFTTHITNLRLDKSFSEGVAAKVMGPKGKRSPWLAIVWLRPA